MMKKYFLLSLIIAPLFLASCNSKDVESESEEPYVILISFDGFRDDYVEKFNTPNFKKFINKGAAAVSMTSSYPSKTFPNHYSIVTGMYPGNHNLVDNTFYDPARQTTYSIGNNPLVTDRYYYSGLPLWQLVQQNGMKSASYFWIGSEAKIAGSYPDYYEAYDGDVPNEARIDTVMDWLNLPSTASPRFISLYFSLVDSQGHSTGPNAKETGDTVLEADRLLGVLMNKLKSISKNVNVIITSDHGMYEMQNLPETYIYLDDVFDGIDISKEILINNGTHTHLFVRDRVLNENIYEQIKAREDRFVIYKKEETPAHWNYRNSDRIGDYLLVAQTGSQFTTKQRQSSNTFDGHVSGAHGFDPYITPEMGAIFYAQGPNIKQGVEVQKFNNVHVYPLIAEILGITTPANIDGKLSVLESILKD
jgi:predicted AlkP superfamily pyrophosphatase or phosphodiesterase